MKQIKNFALRYPFYLQLFADGESGGEGVPQEGTSDPTDKGEPEDKGADDGDKKTPKYTEEDIDKIISRKFAIWQKQQDKAKKEEDEARRLQSMSDEEKRNNMIKSMREELDSLKREKAMGEMAKTARSLLSEKHINVGDEIITNLISDDAEGTKKAVDSFASAFERAVQERVTEKLKGKAPVAGSTGKKITKEEIMKIKNPRERQQKIAENLDLFQSK